MSDVVTIGNDRIKAIIDCSRGAEVRQVTHVATGTDILMSTPWAESAQLRRPVTLAHSASASETHWMETYAGGWQTLFPHAGGPSVVDGVERHYHGEASSIPWMIDTVTAESVRAHVELYTVPTRMDRVVSVSGNRITIHDTIANTSEAEVSYDYQSHPAFGAPFIEAGCFVSADARLYTPDERFDLGEFVAGEPTSWPLAEGRSRIVDLAQIPGPDDRIMRFGWLEDFAENRITITNPRLKLSASVQWDDADRPFAWVWEEVHAHPGPPWFGRGYAVAFEPSTRVTGHRDPAGKPKLAAFGQTAYTTSITLEQENVA